MFMLTDLQIWRKIRSELKCASYRIILGLSACP